MPVTTLALLVVEDDPAVLHLINRVLSPAYDVMLACGAQTAIERTAERRPDGIIMDIGLPGMRGPDLLQLLRTPDTQHTPAIAISGWLNLDERELRACGFATFVRKPFTSAELRSAVEYFIG